AERALGRQRSPGTAALVLAVLLVLRGSIATLSWTSTDTQSHYPGYVLTSRGLVAPSVWMRDHLPAGATVATRRIGTVAYWSGHPVFDYAFGLTEPAVARLIRRRGEAFDSPANPELSALWRQRAPQYLLEDRDTLYGIAASQGGSPECFRLHGMDYRVIRRFPIGGGMEWTLAAHAACSARVGSTLAARRAGKTLASSAVATSTRMTAARVSGSVGPTPTRLAASTRVAAAEAPRPRRTPAATGRMARQRTSFSTSRRVAPSAMRTPISAVRWVTK